MRDKEKNRPSKRRSVVIMNEVQASPAPGPAPSAASSTASVHPPKRRREDKGAAPDPLAVAAAMGRSIVSELAVLQSYKIPKKSSRPNADEDESWVEEETLMVEEASLSFKDNSVDVLALELRSKLRVPNSSAESWWTKDWSHQRVCKPIRGSSLYLENLQGANRPNDDVIMKFHDR